MNISLIGMPACGKSSIALALGKILDNYNIIDTDNIIVNFEKKSINDIFLENGESYFRQLETKILKKILINNNQIISTGGGIIKSNENIRLLKDNSVLFYLKADIETLYNRAIRNKDRPLLNNGNLKFKLNQLLKEREKNYNKANYIINIDSKTPDEIAKEITEIINGKS